MINTANLVPIAAHKSPAGFSQTRGQNGIPKVGRWRVCSIRWHPGLGAARLRSPESQIATVSPANVPLIWGASGDADSTPALDWFTEPVGLFEGRMSARNAVRIGWIVLCEVFREWGIEEHNHLTSWLRRQGFVSASPGSHISARAKELKLGEASRCRRASGFVGRRLCAIGHPHGSRFGGASAPFIPVQSLGKIGRRWIASNSMKFSFIGFQC